jgi:predicted transcriptional regulator of viral defense system
MDKFGHYLKWESFKNTILEKELIYFSLYDLERIFPRHRLGLKKFLSRHTAKKNLIRLKKNLYCLSDKMPDEYLLANILYQPSYLSLEFALSYYSIIPETVYSVTSATTKPTREFTVDGRVFSYQTIKKQAFVGYFPKEINHQTILIATAEKALADYFYFVSLGKKSLNDRIDWQRVKKEIVVKYLTKNFKLSQLRVKKLIE